MVHVIGVFTFIFLVVFVILSLVARVRLLRRLERSSWYVLVPFIVEVLVVSESNLDDKERGNMYNFIWIMLIVTLVNLFSGWVSYFGGFISAVVFIFSIVFCVVFPVVMNKSFVSNSGDSPSLILPIVSAIFLGDSLFYYGFSKNTLISNRDVDFDLTKYNVLGFVILGIRSFTFVKFIILFGMIFL